MKKIILLLLVCAAPSMYAMGKDSAGEKKKIKCSKQLYGCIACCHPYALLKVDATDGCHQYICEYCLTDVEGHTMYDAQEKAHYLSYQCGRCKEMVNFKRPAKKD